MLRFAVVVSEGSLQEWQSACVRRLQESGLAQLCCVIEEHSENASDEHVYERYLRSLRVPSLTPVPLHVVSAGVVAVEAWPHGSIEWRHDVTALSLDFILAFGSPECASDLTECAKYGVWQFLFGEPEFFTTQAPGFWEIYHDRDVTGGLLVRVRANDSLGVPLKSAYLPTIRHSFERNVDDLLATLLEAPLQVCRDIARGHAAYLDGGTLARPAREYRKPHAAQIFRLRLLQARNVMQRYIQMRFFTIDWNVFSLSGPASQFIGGNYRARIDRVYPYSKGAYLADPCVVEHGSQSFVFCEQFVYGDNRGVVVALPLDGKTLAAVKPVIEEPYHLSYPSVFLYENEVFCIAESAAMRKVCLYRAKDFPNQWEYAHTLLRDFRAADATLLRAAGKWWLFCSGGEVGPKSGDDTHLYIWYTDDLMGTWTPHPANPVKVDARSARPAGQLFSHDGILYRPAQDCSRTYGGAITINRIDALSETEYCETVVGKIRPPALGYNKGIHTISSAGERCIVDAKRYVFNPDSIPELARSLVKQALIAAGARPQTIAALRRRAGGGGHNHRSVSGDDRPPGAGAVEQVGPNAPSAGMLP